MTHIAVIKWMVYDHVGITLRNIASSLPGLSLIRRYVDIPFHHVMVYSDLYQIFSHRCKEALLQTYLGIIKEKQVRWKVFEIADGVLWILGGCKEDRK